MKKYHFYVTRDFHDGYLICERGRGNNFMVRFPTKYRAQVVAKWLWKHWKNKSPNLDILKKLVLTPSYNDDWKRLKNLMVSYIPKM